MEKTDIFISYSSKDRQWAQDFASHFDSLNISFWYDQNIQAGRKWNDDIEEAMQKAKMAVLLISVNFMNSTYIKEKELVKLKQRYDNNEIQIIPIYISSCLYNTVNEFKWLDEIQTLPGNKKTLKDADKKDDEICNVVRKINEILHPEVNLSNDDKKKSNYKNLLTKSIMPYLVDRNSQINDMMLNISSKKDKESCLFKSPVIWVIHGDKIQSHYKLIECVEKHFWEDRIYKKNKDEQEGIKLCMLDWPWSSIYQDQDLIKQSIVKQLMNNFSIDNEQEYDLNKIFTYIKEYCKKKPVLIYSDCSTHELENYGKEKMIDNFFEFWKKHLPSYDFNHPLIFCLMLKYTAEMPKKSFINKIFKSKNKASTNYDIKNYIKTNCKKGGYCVIKELMNVEQSDVERWGKRFESIIHDYWSGPDINYEIDLIFKDNNNTEPVTIKSMPMQILGQKLYEKFFK